MALSNAKKQGSRKRRKKTVSEPSESHDDYCGVCKFGGELLCCNTCPMVFHPRCIGYSTLEFVKDDWSCWACCQRKPEVSFVYDTTKVIPKPGDFLYVATHKSCIKYVKCTVKSVQENDILVRWTKTENTIRISNQNPRIWRGDIEAKEGQTVIMNMFQEVDAKFLPVFHSVGIDGNVDGNKHSAAQKSKAPKVSRSKSVRWSDGSGQLKSKKTKQQSLKRKKERKKARKAPLDRNDGDVLQSLHLHEGGNMSNILANEQKMNGLKMTHDAMKIKEGDCVDVWIEPTNSTPGGWAPGTVSKVVIVGDGSGYPFFAFYLVSLDQFDVSNPKGMYREWRPLALERQIHGTQDLFVQVRLKQKTTSPEFSVGDSVEVHVHGLFCPARVTNMDDTDYSLELKSTHSQKYTKIARKSKSSMLQLVSDGQYYGMLCT